MDATAGAVQRGMIMKIEEAIEILKKDIYTDIPRSAIGARNHNTAVAMAIAVLEKIYSSETDYPGSTEWGY